jgi:hypothetical protein
MRQVVSGPWTNEGSNDSLYKVVAKDLISNKRVILHKGLEQECNTVVREMKASFRYNEIYCTEI